MKPVISAIAHGLSMSAKATADIALTWQKIYKLNMVGSSSSPPNNSKATNENSAATKGVTAPKGWITQASKKGGGIVFKDPSNPHNIIRQMPGNPNSPNPLQRSPYVKFMKDGKFYDAKGNPLKSGDLPDAHIPLNQFDINKMPKF